MCKKIFSIRVKSFILFGFLIIFFLVFSLYALNLFQNTKAIIATEQERLVISLTGTGETVSHLDFFTSQIEQAGKIVVFMIYSFIFFVILTFFLLNYIVWRYIIHPIEGLNAAVSRVTEGDYHQRIGEKRRDEIGQLARSFNAMASQLQKNHDLTEKKIAERTADLEKLNKFLVGRELKMIELKKELYQKIKKDENSQ